MFRIGLRFCLGIFWLVVAYAIYFRGAFAPNQWGDPQLVTIAAIMCVLIGISQIVWAVVRMLPRPAAGEPIPVHDRGEEPPEEYNPEFDFNQPAPPQ